MSGSRRRWGAPFWETVEKTEICWLWTASTHDGYGIYWDAAHRRTMRVHTFAWIELRGAPPEGKEPHHLCHVRNCVNPDHIQWVTRQEHRIIEGLETTHCPQGHEYTEENTRIRKYNGKRQCKTCHREREAKARAEGRRG